LVGHNEVQSIANMISFKWIIFEVKRS